MVPSVLENLPLVHFLHSVMHSLSAYEPGSQRAQGSVAPVPLEEEPFSHGVHNTVPVSLQAGHRYMKAPNENEMYHIKAISMLTWHMFPVGRAHRKTVLLETDYTQFDTAYILKQLHHYKCLQTELSLVYKWMNHILCYIIIYLILSIMVLIDHLVLCCLPNTVIVMASTSIGYFCPHFTF